MRWLPILRTVLYGMLVLMLAVMAFAGGVFVARRMAKPSEPLPVVEVPAERRTAARGFVEAALAARFAGRSVQALEYLEEARRQDGTMRGLDYQFALTHLELRNFAEARTVAQRSVDKDEETANAHALLGLIAFERALDSGAVESAREEILDAIKASRATDPLNPMPFYVLAEFHRAAGEPEAAVEAYRKALERVSKTDGIMVSTVKAGLAGLRLHYEPGSPTLKLQKINGIYPPEQLFFGAADALLRGDRERADDYLRQAKERLPTPLFDALLQDSFFQDYLTDDIGTIGPSE
jgi:tetratricopeptide (TPR) repeat protein